MRRQRNAAALCFVALALAACSSTAVPPAPSPSPDLPKTLHLGWVWPQEHGGSIGPPAVGLDGTVYVLDTAGTLRAFSPAGEELWQYREPAGCGADLVLAPDGQLLHYISPAAGSSSSVLRAVGADGQPRWSYPFAEEVYEQPVVAPDGTVYLQAEGPDWSNVGYQVRPGGIGQRFQALDNIRSGFTVDDEGQVYGWAFEEDEFQVISPDGQVQRRCPGENPLRGPYAGPGGRFYYVGPGGEVVARDGQCNYLWTNVLSPTVTETADLPLAVADDGTLYVGGPAGRVYALSAQGALLWRRQGTPDVGEVVQLARGPDGTLFALDDWLWLHALDRQGHETWAEQLFLAGLPAGIQSTPAGGLAVVQGGYLQVYTYDDRAVYHWPAPAPPAAAALQAQQEIVSFMLGYIVHGDISSIATTVQEYGEPWVGAPPEASLLVLGPAESAASDQDPPLDGVPLRVWWYVDGRLTEVADAQRGIDEYHRRYVDDPAGGVFPYSISTFGIVQLRADGQEAEVYSQVVCGPLCGWGGRLILRRSPSGQWWVVRSASLWIS